MRRLLLLLVLALPLSALELTVDTIMRGNGLAGYVPHAVRWAPDGKSVYFEWKQYSDPVEEDYDTYVVGRDGKGLRKLSLGIDLFATAAEFCNSPEADGAPYFLENPTSTISTSMLLS